MTHTAGELRTRGALALVLNTPHGSEGVLEPEPLAAWPRIPSLDEIIRHGLPQRGLSEHVNRWRARNFRNLTRGARRVLAARALGLPHFYGALYLDLHRADGRTEHLGLASLRVITTAGVTRIVDGLQSSATDLSLWRFHAFGTGGTAEAVGDTALVTELTTQYATDNTRPTGSQTEASATVYRTVGTLDPDANVAITEHGVLTQAATGGGTLLDRSLFSVVNVDAAGDTLQATYDATFAAGG